MTGLIALITEQKICGRCRAWKPLTDFHTDRKRPDGHKGACKACEKQRRDELIAADPERYKGYKKAWNQRHPDKVRAQSKKWYEANREYDIANSRAWNDENRGRVRENKRISWSRHRERYLEGLRAWRKANPLQAAEKDLRDYLSAVERGKRPRGPLLSLDDPIFGPAFTPYDVLEHPYNPPPETIILRQERLDAIHGFLNDLWLDKEIGDIGRRLIRAYVAENLDFGAAARRVDLSVREASDLLWDIRDKAEREGLQEWILR